MVRRLKAFQHHQWCNSHAHSLITGKTMLFTSSLSLAVHHHPLVMLHSL